MRDLKELRVEIDEIDKAMQSLFERRMSVASEIADYKKANNLPILDSSREKEKINAMRASASDEFMADGIARLFETLMAISRDYQKERNKND